MRFGYTLMTEQAGPRQLVDDGVRAEQAGFDLTVISDHVFPWLASQGHSSYAWAVLGAVAHATERTELMTYVTCPLFRYHPVVIAQKAATVQLLAEGRFTLGLGAGENLNEHIVGGGWPPVNVRHDMLDEAIDIISSLFDGGDVSRKGPHFPVDSARVWDLPDQRVPIGVAVSGPQSVGRFAPKADVMIAVEPDASLAPAWDAAARQAPARKVGQLPVSWGERDEAVAVAHDQFRWFGGGWKVNAELPGPAAFAAASQFVTPDDVASSMPCGEDVDAVVKAVAEFRDAGFTDVALVQIGGDAQDRFLSEAAGPLLEKLRAAS
jgi:G6PDH family F420-dependent oxidoreductase